MGDSERRLRPKARLLGTIGRDLISSEKVALIELVKNAWDADATHVLIHVHGSPDDEGAIRVQSIDVLDDGIGMPTAVVGNAWLEPATAFRKADTSTDRGRRVLGEKGVGRFAAAKLGDTLELHSKHGDGPEVHLGVAWSDFDVEDLYLDEVPVLLEDSPSPLFAPGTSIADRWGELATKYPKDLGRLDPDEAATSGTLLEIGAIQSTWSEDLVEEVRLALARLVSPFTKTAGVDEDFGIILELPEGLGWEGGPITPPTVLERPHYRLVADVGVDGTTRGEIEVVTSDAAPERFRAPFRRPDGAPPSCGPLRVQLNVWDRDPSALKAVAPDDSIKSVRSTLDAAAGVSIYRDGFRVLPFGEPGDDWLGLDLRRVNNPTMRLSNNQIVGVVFISRDDNPRLVDQTNREGLIGGPAYDDLRTVVLDLIGRLEVARYAARPRKTTRRSRTSLLDRIDLSELQREIKKALPTDSRVAVMVRDLQAELDARNEAVGETLARYHRLATLGQIVDRVVHELSQPLSGIRKSAALAMTDLRSLGASADTKKIVGRLDRIVDQAGVIGDVIKRLRPFGGRRRGRPPRFPVEDAIVGAVDLLQPDLDERKIVVELPTTNHTVSLDGTELQEVLINLLTNSMHWLEEVDDSDRTIRITVEQPTAQELAIVVEDSGPGVGPDIQDLIFDPYFSTRANGVGLGLPIAGEIVTDYYDGTLELLDPGELGGARFRATLRRRIG